MLGNDERGAKSRGNASPRPAAFFSARARPKGVNCDRELEGLAASGGRIGRHPRVAGVASCPNSAPTAAPGPVWGEIGAAAAQGNCDSRAPGLAHDRARSTGHSAPKPARTLGPTHADGCVATVATRIAGARRRERRPRRMGAGQRTGKLVSQTPFSPLLRLATTTRSAPHRMTLSGRQICVVGGGWWGWA